MLVNTHHRFITQRDLARLALFRCEVVSTGFVVSFEKAVIELPWTVITGAPVAARLWDDVVSTIEPSANFSRWFSEQLNTECRLVFMPDYSERKLDAAYATGLNGLSDGYPYLLANDASLTDLNNRMAHPVTMDRFRPNIVIDGLEPWQEDDILTYQGDQVVFKSVKPCSRCVVITTDQQTGIRSKEPLHTLSTFRRSGKTVMFGVNATAPAGMKIRTGERITIA
jgi:uncharacterized protein YcbX